MPTPKRTQLQLQHLVAATCSDTSRPAPERTRHSNSCTPQQQRAAPYTSTLAARIGYIAHPPCSSTSRLASSSTFHRHPLTSMPAPKAWFEARTPLWQQPKQNLQQHPERHQHARFKLYTPLWQQATPCTSTLQRHSKGTNMPARKHVDLHVCMYTMLISMWECICICILSMYMYMHMCTHYESQPVGLAEVISASEASLGGPGGRASQMYKNRVKSVVKMTFHLRVMYQVAIGWRWGSTPPWSAFWPWYFLSQLKPFLRFQACSLGACFAKRHFTRHTWQELVFAKRHFTRHTWQSTFSFSLSCKTAFHSC